MAARVFISCGQREGERETARAVAQRFTAEGFDPYVALEAQSIQDVNSGIIGELRRSDYYVFIDLRREPVTVKEGVTWYRGSLFSHQELAIAYAMGFEHAIFFRQSGALLEGVAAYMASNATPFDDPSEVVGLVADAVRRRHWDPRYSRNLAIANLRLTDSLLTYGDLYGRFLYVDVQNRRPDLGAAGTVARLSALRVAGGERQPSPNRSHLKVTGQHMAYEQTIWPRSHGAFDLLCVDAQSGCRVYLNNALDVVPRPVLLDKPGEHVLEYEVFAHGFDIRRFGVKLVLAARCADARAELLPRLDDAEA